MEIFNSTTNKIEINKTSLSSRNLTLDQFKKRLLETHNKTRTPILAKQPSLFPKISTYHPLSTVNSNFSRTSESAGMTTVSFMTNSTKTRTNTELRNSVQNIPFKKTIEINDEEVEYDEAMDKDINPLISYYHFTSTSQASNNFERFHNNFSLSQKSELFNKYKINKKETLNMGVIRCVLC